MPLKLIDISIEADQMFGPMPNFNDSFEKFFIQKAFNLLYSQNLNQTETSDLIFKQISLLNECDLNWMYDIELSKNSRQQNMEIIYNDNEVYFKTIKIIHKDEILNAFPSKDLEISLGLQYIPINSENKYMCKKCSKYFEYQFSLMLHSRYFCLSNTKNYLHNFDEKHSMLNKRKHVELECDNQNLKKSKKNHVNYEKKELEKTVTQTEQINQNLILQNVYNWSNFYNQFQTAIMNYTKNKNIYDQYLNTPNQALRDYFQSKMSSFIENQSKNVTNQEILNKQSMSPNSADSLSPLFSPISSLSSQNDLIPKNITQNQNLTSLQNNSNFNKQSKFINTQPARLLTPSDSITIKQNLTDLKFSFNNQTLQNWCAKCNTHFRLTSDLVYHMRTFHRKDEIRSKSSDLDLNNSSNRYGFIEDKKYAFNSTVNREIKYLKCEICNEQFKEKHHLTRHLTSHR